MAFAADEVRLLLAADHVLIAAGRLAEAHARILGQLDVALELAELARRLFVDRDDRQNLVLLNLATARRIRAFDL